MPPSDSSPELDLTAQLANRARATVPPRNKKSLLSDKSPGPDTPAPPAAPRPDGANLDDLTRAVDNLPKMGKRLAVSLEEDLRARLLLLCSQQNITPETFLEAAVSLLSEYPDAFDAILAEAQARYQHRKEAGHLRRTLTSLQKLQG